MNWTVLRSFGFIVDLIATVAGLLVAQGAVLSGSTADHVIGWILAVAGAVGGHQLTAGKSEPAKV